MTARIGHRISDGGVVVVIRELEQTPFLAHLTTSEAKRFAWGLLADLDPDDDGSERVEQRTPGDRPPGSGSQTIAILRALHPDQATSAAELVRRTGIDTRFIGARVCRLRDLGWVKRVDGARGRGFRARYQLTPEGEAALIEATS